MSDQEGGPSIPKAVLEKCFEHSGTDKVKGVVVIAIDEECIPRVWSKTSSVGIDFLMEGCMTEYVDFKKTTRQSYLKHDS